MAVDIQKFLKSSTVVFSYKENSLRGMIVEGVVGSVSGLALPAVVDATETGVLYSGDPVTVVETSTGTPKFIKCDDAAKCNGFVSYETKQTGYVAGQVFTLAATGKVIQLVAAESLTIKAGDKLYLDLTDADNITVTNVAGEGATPVAIAEEAIETTDGGALIAARIIAPLALAEVAGE